MKTKSTRGQNMVSTITTVFAVILSIWFILSYAEIMVKSGQALNNTPHYNKMNLIILTCGDNKKGGER